MVRKMVSDAMGERVANVTQAARNLRGTIPGYDPNDPDRGRRWDAIERALGGTPLSEDDTSKSKTIRVGRVQRKQITAEELAVNAKRTRGRVAGAWCGKNGAKKNPDVLKNKIANIKKHLEAHPHDVSQQRLLAKREAQLAAL